MPQSTEGPVTVTQRRILERLYKEGPFLKVSYFDKRVLNGMERRGFVSFVNKKILGVVHPCTRLLAAGKKIVA